MGRSSRKGRILAGPGLRSSVTDLPVLMKDGVVWAAPDPACLHRPVRRAKGFPQRALPLACPARRAMAVLQPC